ncbi:hypothetical protein Scep_014647 [Stephania cephalantha]|uniref:Uncharacterized protein n=1 Tax=Stephania cephalantha TaxID=152367 RepID=A0AAP0P384_9MAGN
MKTPQKFKPPSSSSHKSPYYISRNPKTPKPKTNQKPSKFLLLQENKEANLFDFDMIEMKSGVDPGQDLCSSHEVCRIHHSYARHHLSDSDFSISIDLCNSFVFNFSVSL